MDSYFLQLLIYLCVLIFQESLFLIFFTVLPVVIIVSVVVVAATCNKWFISVILVSFSFRSSGIPFIYVRYIHFSFSPRHLKKPHFMPHYLKLFL
jgi:hypothetical protein